MLTLEVLAGILKLNYFLALALLCHGPTLPWVVYYNDQAPAEAFLPFNPIILDSAHHPPLAPLIKENKSLFGYVNLAEAEDRHSWFTQIKAKGILIEENLEWRGSWVVDIRQPVWKDFLLNQIIPPILSEGFSGLFLDQIDISLELEKKDPKKYQKMKEAAIDLIQSIRKKYPKIKLMLNRGYDILDLIGNEIDFVLAETLYTSYNSKINEYYIRPKEEFEWQLAQLNKARFLFPHLTLFSLDYWDPEDQEMYQQIYAVERSHWMRPYVATRQLDTIYTEPRNP